MAIKKYLLDQIHLLKQRRKFYEFHDYHFDLKTPETFNEKIVWRKVFDRNPLFPTLQDKLAARNYVKEIIGEKTAENILVPLLYVTEDPHNIPFHDLPDEYVVKPNHGSSWIRIVDRKRPASQEEVVSKCRKWLGRTYARSRMEWAYGEIRPCIMFEKLLRDSRGGLASDFKFYVFHGRVEWVKVILDRFGSSTELHYDRDFREIRMRSGMHPIGSGIPKPESFDEMVRLAEQLAGSMDMIRIDFLSVESQIFFGEFTLYPSSGFNHFYPDDFDRYFGQLWKLDHTYARDFKPLF